MPRSNAQLAEVIDEDDGTIRLSHACLVAAAAGLSDWLDAHPDAVVRVTYADLFGEFGFPTDPNHKFVLAQARDDFSRLDEMGVKAIYTVIKYLSTRPNSCTNLFGRSDDPPSGDEQVIELTNDAVELEDDRAVVGIGSDLVMTSRAYENNPTQENFERLKVAAEEAGIFDGDEHSYDVTIEFIVNDIGISRSDLGWFHENAENVADALGLDNSERSSLAKFIFLYYLHAVNSAHNLQLGIIQELVCLPFGLKVDRRLKANFLEVFTETETIDRAAKFFHSHCDSTPLELGNLYLHINSIAAEKIKLCKGDEYVSHFLYTALVRHYLNVDCLKCQELKHSTEFIADIKYIYEEGSGDSLPVGSLDSFDQLSDSGATENGSTFDAASSLTVDEEFELDFQFYSTTSRFFKPVDRKVISKALRFARSAHEGQMTADGRPYVTQPIGAAEILTKNVLDPKVIAGAILSNVRNDTAITNNDITNEFGSDIAFLACKYVNSKTIESVLSSHIELPDYSIDSGLFFTVHNDVGIIFIALASRLQSLRSMIKSNHMPLHKQRRIADKTIKLYVPVAEKLHCYDIRDELRNICEGVLVDDVDNTHKAPVDVGASSQYDSVHEYDKQFANALVDGLDVVDAHHMSARNLDLSSIEPHEVFEGSTFRLFLGAEYSEDGRLRIGDAFLNEKQTTDLILLRHFAGFSLEQFNVLCKVLSKETIKERPLMEEGGKDITAEVQLNEAFEAISNLDSSEQIALLNKFKNHAAQQISSLQSVVPPLPEPDNTGRNYKRFVSRTDPLVHVEEVFGAWIKHFNPELDRDYLFQDQLQKLDAKLLASLRNRFKHDVKTGRSTLKISDVIPPKSARLDAEIAELPDSVQKRLSRLGRAATGRNL